MSIQPPASPPQAGAFSSIVTALLAMARALSGIQSAINNSFVNVNQTNTFTAVQVFTKPPVINAGAVGNSTFQPEGNIFVGLSALGLNSPPTLVETAMFSFLLQANSLDAIGRGLRFYAIGSFANNADGKTVRVRLGGTMNFSSGLLTAANVTWEIRGRIYKTGASTQVGFFDMLVGTTPQAPVVITGSELDTTTLTVSLTVQSAVVTAADIVVNGFVVEFQD